MHSNYLHNPVSYSYRTYCCYYYHYYHYHYHYNFHYYYYYYYDYYYYYYYYSHTIYIESPRYPSCYPNNNDWKWLITGDFACNATKFTSSECGTIGRTLPMRIICIWKQNINYTLSVVFSIHHCVFNSNLNINLNH